jgi:hypothetical protein
MDTPVNGVEPQTCQHDTRGDRVKLPWCVLCGHEAERVSTPVAGLSCLFQYRTKGLNLNSVNQLIFVMVKCCVLFEVRTEFLNNI